MTQQTQTKQLPRGWKEATLKELSIKITDGTHQTPKYLSEGIPFISTTNLITGGKDFDFGKYKKFISKENYKELTKSCIPEKGDILISKCGTIGRTQLVRINYPFSIFVGLGLIKIKKETILGEYLEYFLTSPKVQKELERLAPGSTRRTLTIGAINQVNIYYPESKEEQQLIVSEIETQFSRLDEAVKVLKLVKDKLKVYRKAVLKKAFERDSWEYSKIGKIFKTSSGGTPSRANKRYYTGNIPWLKSGELMDKTNIEDSEEHISKEALEKSSAEIFPIDTTLIAMYGATTGKIGIIKKECSTNQAICGIFPNQDSLSKFIFYFLLFKRERIINQSKGGAQPNINQEIIKNLDFPLLSKIIQQSVVQEIESKFSVINKVEEVVNQSLIKAEKLRKSILKFAFEGKLVKTEEMQK